MEKNELIKELRDNLQKMELSLGATKDAIVWINNNAEIQWCNKLFSNLAKISRTNILHKNINSILPLDEKNKIKNWLKILQISKKNLLPPIYEVETQGKKRCFEIFFQPFQKIGKGKNTILVLHDVTASQNREIKLQKNNKNLQIANDNLVKKNLLNSKLSAIFDCSDDAIISLNIDGVIESWNKGAEKLYGYKKEEIIGKLAILLYPEDIQKDFYHAIEQIKLGNNVLSMDTIRKHKDKHIFPVSLKMSPIIDKKGKVVGACKIVRDISEWKKITNLKNDFISIVSHELRTPLTSIQGSLSLITKGMAGKLSPKARDLLNICEQNSNRLIGIINDILDIQKLETGKLKFNFESIEIESLVNEAIKVNQPFADKFNKYFKLTIKNTGKVKVDRYRILQVLDNLISNAIKFSTSAEIKITILEKNKYIRIEIMDRGISIEKEFYPKIFQKFSQGGVSSNQTQPGSGLGLAISKEIIEKHNGRIGFKQKNQEITFYFELPKVKTKQAKKYFNKIPFVLICEANKKIASILQKKLHENAIQATIIDSAKKAKKIIGERHVDAVITSLVLSDQDGISFIKELKTIDQSLLIIALSSVNRDGEIIGSMLPIIDWLEIPFDHKRLLNAVKLIKQKTILNAPNILYIEDDNDLIKVVGSLLEYEANVFVVSNINEAKKVLKEKKYNLVILDIVLPDGSGVELLPIISKKKIPIIVFSAYEFPKNYSNYVAKILTKTEVSPIDLVNDIKMWLQ